VIASDAARRLRLALEPLNRLGVQRRRRVERLDGHTAPDAHVLPLVDRPHASFAD
jgi:hypothetical protein